MAIENLTKRIAAATSALAQQGGGIPLMSWHQVQKEIMGRTDEEISTMLNEIRVESALAKELELTNQIIKKTGLFNKADRLYGEPGASYQGGQDEQEGGMGDMGGGSMPPMGGDFGGGLDDLGEPGADIGGDIGGEEGGMDLEASGGDEQMPLSESAKDMISAFSKGQFFETYMAMLNKKEAEEKKRPEILSENILINETLTSTINELASINEEVSGETKLDAVLNEIKD